MTSNIAEVIARVREAHARNWDVTWEDALALCAAAEEREGYADAVQQWIAIDKQRNTVVAALRAERDALRRALERISNALEDSERGPSTSIYDAMDWARAALAPSNPQGGGEHTGGA